MISQIKLIVVIHYVITLVNCVIEDDIRDIHKRDTDIDDDGRRQAIINALLLNNKTYDARIPPNYEDDFPTNVTVQMYVLSFDSVNEASMDYSMTIFLRTNWTDRRLKWTDDKADKLQRLEIDTKLMDNVWMPDVYFVNEKTAKVHDVTVANRLLHIFRDGTIKSSMRISLTASCDMYLQRYPHDAQICSLRIGSYSYSAENVVYQWHGLPLMMRNGLTLPRFRVNFDSAEDVCDHNFNSGDSGNIIVGRYTCIQADFTLTREFGYYICQVYIPSVLIVVLSWVSFWIDIDAIPARISLGLLTVLTMTTQSTGARGSLPRVSYIKAIDVWMSVCLLFVFAALLEFAYVNVQARVEKRRRESFLHSIGPGHHGKPPDHGMDDYPPSELGNKQIRLTMEDVEEKLLMLMNDYENKAKKHAHYNGDCKTTKVTISPNKRFMYLKDKLRRQRARMADKISRIAFPAVFLGFNVVYWVVYTYYVG